MRKKGKLSQYDINAIEMTKRVVLFSHANKMFPKHYPKPKDEIERESRELYGWVYRSNYFDGNFKYRGVCDENGQMLEEKIEEVYLKYASNIQGSLPYLLSVVERIEKYCNEYKEWPRHIPNPKTEKEITSDKLYDWLQRNGLTNAKMDENNPKYKREKWQIVLSHLQKIYSKYGYTVNGTAENFLHLLDEIEHFCIKNNRWIKKYPNPKNELEKKSNHLYERLRDTHYHSSKREFIYMDLKDRNGILVKERLDALYRRYSSNNQNSPYYVQAKVEEIISFCEKYGFWPRQYSNPKNELEMYSDNLYVWLSAHHFLTDFDYREYVYDDGEEIEDRLNSYYIIYSRHKSKDGIRVDDPLDIWKAKDSKDISASLYYLIAELRRTRNNCEIELAEYYLELLKSKIRISKVDLSIDDVLDILDMEYDIALSTLNERKEKYVKDSNFDLATLFENWIDFTIMTKPKILNMN